MSARSSGCSPYAAAAMSDARRRQRDDERAPRAATRRWTAASPHPCRPAARTARPRARRSGTRGTARTAGSAPSRAAGTRARWRRSTRAPTGGRPARRAHQARAAARAPPAQRRQDPERDEQHERTGPPCRCSPAAWRADVAEPPHVEEERPVVGRRAHVEAVATRRTPAALGARRALRPLARGTGPPGANATPCPRSRASARTRASSAGVHGRRRTSTVPKQLPEDVAARAARRRCAAGSRDPAAAQRLEREHRRAQRLVADELVEPRDVQDPVGRAGGRGTRRTPRRCRGCSRSARRPAPSSALSVSVKPMWIWS